MIGVVVTYRFTTALTHTLYCWFAAVTIVSAQIGADYRANAISGAGISYRNAGADRQLTVAVSLDIPPYVMSNATSGVEVELVRRALPDRELKWIQMDYAALESAVSDKKADIAMSVQSRKPNVYYSVDYIGFVNFAISKKSDKLNIQSVVDLKGHPVLTWQDAWTELGDEFKTQYAPRSEERTNYIEVADQAQQVREFWNGDGKIIVIDRSIFDYFSEHQGHSPSEVEYHALFPKVTRFKVGFADAAVRDEFNARLKQLCENGEYVQLFKRYKTADLAGVCDQVKASHPTSSPDSSAAGLWSLYEQFLKHAKYVDLTHTLTPSIPVWKGFGPCTFGPALNPKTGKPYEYAKDGFEATRYSLSTDQFGTQLDPPAHWAPEYPAIDELPATYAIRPLVVISIVDQVAQHPGYALQVSDIEKWEAKHGKIPTGSVVMVRSDWSKKWPDPALATQAIFPGVSLAALKFLHEQRHILFHGHEPLDTDMTPTLEGEHWLLHHGYTQAEGVANLDKVPETGALVTIGYPKFKGGLGGYARYIAICPPDWIYGVSVDEVPGAPLPKSDKILHWDTKRGVRMRN